MPRTSLYAQHLEASLMTPVPTLERTPAAVRDQAVRDARSAESDLAEARQLLENSHALLCAISLWIEVGPGKILAPDTTGKIVSDLQRGANETRAFLNRPRI